MRHLLPISKCFNSWLSPAPKFLESNKGFFKTTVNSVRIYNSVWCCKATFRPKPQLWPGQLITLIPTLLTSAPLPCLKSKEVSDSFLTQLKITSLEWAVLILISMMNSSCLTYSHSAFPGAPATPIQDNLSFLSSRVSALTSPRHCPEKQFISLSTLDTLLSISWQHTFHCSLQEYTWSLFHTEIAMEHTRGNKPPFPVQEQSPALTNNLISSLCKTLLGLLHVLYLTLWCTSRDSWGKSESKQSKDHLKCGKLGQIFQAPIFHSGVQNITFK